MRECPDHPRTAGDPVTRDQVLDLCSNLPGAVEDYPFGDDVAVFKIGGNQRARLLGG
jgi:predicted DNA-binding protein (MmcQ/YjbR family)